MLKKVEFIFDHKKWLLLLSIFILELFLRFYQIETRNIFGWDQIDNAWAAWRIVVEHKFPLIGMAAKGNSGIYMGPAYYYFISVFYWLTNLDPVASGVFAGFTSIFTFWTIFYITKKLFSFNVALIAVFINTVSFAGIFFDRVQWNVNLIPSISLIIFYALYNVLNGKPKYLILLAMALGFSFHVHFTSIFYPIIIFLSLPFLPRTKETFKYILLSIPVFFIWLVPNLIAEFQSRNVYSGSLFKYSNIYYHGIHLRRILQLTQDAVIQFNPFLYFDFLNPLKYILIPLFVFFYFIRNPLKKNFLFCYLLILWFLIPWIVFSTYSGEISDYYFSVNRFIVVILISYFLLKLFQIKYLFIKVLLVSFLALYAFVNINRYFEFSYSYGGSLQGYKVNTLKAIREGKIIQFQERVPESYLYYYYTKNKK